MIVNKNTSTDKLLSAGMIIGVIIIIVWTIFSDVHKVEKHPSSPVTKEVIKEKEAPAEPGYAIPKNIFPTDVEAIENLKNQLKRQQALDKALAERKQIAIDVRASVAASLGEQPASTTGEDQASGVSSQAATGQSSAKKTPISASQAAANLKLERIRIDQFKHKELFLHH